MISEIVFTNITSLFLVGLFAITSIYLGTKLKWAQPKPKLLQRKRYQR
jgi:hypothetical protein